MLSFFLLSGYDDVIDVFENFYALPKVHSVSAQTRRVTNKAGGLNNFIYHKNYGMFMLLPRLKKYSEHLNLVRYCRKNSALAFINL